MGKKKKTAAYKLKKKEEPKELFKVFSKKTNKPVYLGEGVEEKEANRLSDQLADDTYIKLVKGIEG